MKYLEAHLATKLDFDVFQTVKHLFACTDELAGMPTAARSYRDSVGLKIF